MAEFTSAGDPPDHKLLAQLGFAGLRRIEILRFARPFIKNGTIDMFPEDLEKPKMVNLMESYLGQGKFGPDPFGTRKASGADEIADLKARLADMEKMMTGLGAAEKSATPGTGYVAPPTGHVAEPTTMKGAADMDWPDLKARAAEFGIPTWHKKKEILVAEVEGAEMEQKSDSKPTDGD